MRNRPCWMESPPRLKCKRALKFPSTPIAEKSAQKNGRHLMTSSLYVPKLDILREDFDKQFNKFLASLYKVTKQLREHKKTFLLPREKQLKVMNKELRKLHLTLSSMGYWKMFFCEYIERCPDVLQLFELTDLREVDEILESAQLPARIFAYTRQNLTFWRNMIKEKSWMVEYRRNMQELRQLEKEIEEMETRRRLLRELMAAIDEYEIDLNDILATPDEHIESFIIKKVQQKSAERELVRLPRLSKRSNTREWCSRHYENVAPGCQSDDESTTDHRSSINAVRGAGGSTPFDISDDEDDIEDYFAKVGL